MWGDDANKGYGLVKFDTSSISQLNGQTNVKVNFNCQVRADRMGINPGYKSDTPTKQGSGNYHAGSKNTQPNITYNFEPSGLRRCMASPAKQVKSLTPEQGRYIDQLREFHKKSDHKSTESTSKQQNRTLSKTTENDFGY